MTTQTNTAAQVGGPESSLGQTRTLTIQFDNLKWRKATVLDSERKTELYRVESHVRNPQIIMHSLLENVPSAESTGEATFHTLSSRIDIRLHGQEIELNSRGFLKDGYTYVSRARPGATMTWKSKSKLNYLELVCLDERAIPVARTSFPSWSLTSAGTIELAGEETVKRGREMDEIILTGLAMMQQRMTVFASAIST
jgi:hypothetical protein